MKAWELIIDKTNFLIKWFDKQALSSCEIESLEDKKLTELFVIDRAFTSFIRWASSEEEDDFQGNLVLKNSEDLCHVKVVKTQRNLHLFLNNKGKDQTDFTKIFWNVFSQTFPGGLLFIDKNLNIVEVSHRLLSLFTVKNKRNISLSKKSVIGKNLNVLFSDGIKSSMYELLLNDLEKIRHSRDIIEHDFKYHEKNFRIILGGVFDGSLYLGSSIYVFDITNEVRKNQLIKDQEVKLFQSSRLAALGEMAGGIAHEINNPLAIISASVQMLKKAKEKNKLNDDFFFETLEDVNETVMRITKIITGLRVVTRESDGEKLEEIVLRDIFTDVLGLCSEKFKSHGVELKVDLNTKDFDYKVVGDRVQLSQVFVNLLGNAYDAIEDKEDKWVEIQIKKIEETEKIEVRIIDCGEGIPLKIQEKIFDPFYTSKEIGKGTGLGLSISKNIMKNNMGDLQLDRSCKNTCFVVSLRGQSL